MTLHAFTMLAAGIGIPVLAALNAAHGRHIGAPATAAAVLFCVALLTALIAMGFTGAQGIPKLLSAPRHLFLGGVLVAFYVLSVTYIAPRFGVGNAVFFVLLGQLISSAVIDQFGLFGAKAVPLSLSRIAGIAMMVVGVVLTQRG